MWLLFADEGWDSARNLLYLKVIDRVWERQPERKCFGEKDWGDAFDKLNSRFKD